METEILFKERQKFKQWWLWVILLGVNGLFLFGVFRQVAGGHQFGNKPMSNAGLLIAAGLMMVFTIVFAIFRLDTQIKKDGIYVRFFPFQVKFRHYSWDSLSKSYVRKYSPISEYGGWGLRFGLFGKGTAYNVSGNKGLQLEFANNKKLLIGTNKADELTAVLSRMEQIKL